MRAASTAFLGLVPREDSSGTRQRKGAITKAGPATVRALLVQAAWAVWRQRRAAGACTPGSSGWRPGAGDASRSSAWRAGWRACSMRCGATACISRDGVGRVSERRRMAQPPDGVMSTVRARTLRRCHRDGAPRHASHRVPAASSTRQQSTHRRVRGMRSRHGGCSEHRTPPWLGEGGGSPLAENTSRIRNKTIA